MTSSLGEVVLCTEQPVSGSFYCDTGKVCPLRPKKVCFSIRKSSCYSSGMTQKALVLLLQKHAGRSTGLPCSCSTSVRSFYSRWSVSNSCVRDLSESMKSKCLPGSRGTFLLTETDQYTCGCYKNIARSLQNQKSLRYM